jgi:DNA-binding XRE family transcriptional regulator
MPSSDVKFRQTSLNYLRTYLNFVNLRSMAARSRVTNGPAIRELRERAGILQAELAQRIGVSASYLSRIEYGTETPGLTSLTVQNLAAELRVSLDDITVAVPVAEALPAVAVS